MNGLSTLNHRIAGVIPALSASRPRWAFAQEDFDRLPSGWVEGAKNHVL